MTDPKIQQIWMCALNYDGCLVTYKDGTKAAVGPSTIKDILVAYKKWLREHEQVQTPSGIARMDDRLTLFFRTIGIEEIAFI